MANMKQLEVQRNIFFYKSYYYYYYLLLRPWANKFLEKTIPNYES